MALEEMKPETPKAWEITFIFNLQLKGHLQAHAQDYQSELMGHAHSDKSWSITSLINWVLIIRPAAGVLVHTCAHIHMLRFMPTYDFVYVASWVEEAFISILNKCHVEK